MPVYDAHVYICIAYAYAFLSINYNVIIIPFAYSNTWNCVSYRDVAVAVSERPWGVSEKTLTIPPSINKLSF